jgi:hypothetical protein
MKDRSCFVRNVIFIAFFLMAQDIYAGMPMTNLEGVGGLGFNPLAYPANGKTSLGDSNSLIGRIFGKPQVGVWYVNFNEIKANWTSVGVADTIGKRVEVSFAHETISVKGFRDDITKDDFGLKLPLLDENFDGNKWMPAVSLGFVGKHSNDVPLANTDDTGYDIYLVASKFITVLPKPILISGGIVSTDSQTTGVFGYNDDRDITWFGNVDVLPLKNVALGIEYKQGAKFDDGFVNADYWNAHAAWFINNNLTFIAAYVNAGNENSSRKVGLGQGIVLSLQYAF